MQRFINSNKQRNIRVVIWIPVYRSSELPNDSGKSPIRLYPWKKAFILIGGNNLRSFFGIILSFFEIFLLTHFCINFSFVIYLRFVLLACSYVLGWGRPVVQHGWTVTTGSLTVSWKQNMIWCKLCKSLTELYSFVLERVQSNFIRNTNVFLTFCITFEGLVRPIIFASS